jgi:hypothetical protein
MKIELDVDLEKFRISLVGDGYIKQEVELLSEEKLVSIFKQRTLGKLEREYSKSLRICY